MVEHRTNRDPKHNHSGRNRVRHRPNEVAARTPSAVSGRDGSLPRPAGAREQLQTHRPQRNVACPARGAGAISAAMTVERQQKKPGESRVVVAMSGGVDSSVTAALLAEQGHDVVGVTLQLYDHGQAVGRAGSCCAGQDIHDARRVADRLGIPHYVLDYEQRFRDRRHRRFRRRLPRRRDADPVRALQPARQVHRSAGRRPRSRRRGPGHRPLRPPHRRAQTAPELHRGAEARARPELFPVRNDAGAARLPALPAGRHGARPRPARWRERFGLPVARQAGQPGHLLRADRRLRPACWSGCARSASRPGEIVDLDGRVLGRHRGHRPVHHRPAARARHRVERAAVRRPPRAGDARGSWSARRRRCFAAACAAARSTGSATAALPDEGARVEVKLRSQQPPVAATVRAAVGEPGGAEVILDRPQAAVAPGQACVFYHGERVLGGGWIRRGDR